MRTQSDGTRPDAGGWTVERAAQLRQRVTPAMERAAQLARAQAVLARAQTVQAAGQAREWATPWIVTAVDWAGPRVERGIDRGIKAAAPRIEAAAERAVPAVDAMRDRIIEQVLPRLVEAVNRAAAAGAAAGQVAGRRLEDATEVGARRAREGLLGAADRAAVISGSKSRRRAARGIRMTAVAAVGAGAVAVGAGAVAGVAAWRRARTEEAWETAAEDLPGTGTSTAPADALPERLADPATGQTSSLGPAEAGPEAGGSGNGAAQTGDLPPQPPSDAV
ncbi:MAG TPA: hypothetical protein VFP72_12410 [Kineosporiaceae bacterium]|nr:hypothetical protein [Kineosporiaceae bacterium]